MTGLVAPEEGSNERVIPTTRIAAAHVLEAIAAE